MVRDLYSSEASGVFQHQSRAVHIDDFPAFEVATSGGLRCGDGGFELIRWTWLAEQQNGGK